MYFLYSWFVALFPLMSSTSLVITTTTKIPFLLEPFGFWDSTADSMAHACRLSSHIEHINKSY